MLIASFDDGTVAGVFDRTKNTPRANEMGEIGKANYHRSGLPPLAPTDFTASLKRFSPQLFACWRSSKFDDC